MHEVFHMVIFPDLNWESATGSLFSLVANSDVREAVVDHRGLLTSRR